MYIGVISGVTFFSQNGVRSHFFPKSGVNSQRCGEPVAAAVVAGVHAARIEAVSNPAFVADWQQGVETGCGKLASMLRLHAREVKGAVVCNWT